MTQMGFEELDAGHGLAQTAARYAQILDIPTPRLGTMAPRNAFAMGSSPSDATVTIGRPLIDTLRPEEVEAILGHELGHVVSGEKLRAPFNTVPYQLDSGIGERSKDEKWWFRIRLAPGRIA